MSVDALPKHVAIIMDGNGRWAKQQKRSRVAGHEAGVQTVINVIEACAEKNIQYLTLFTFGLDNSRRPGAEVSALMKLLQLAFERYLERLIKNDVKLNVIGNLELASKRIRHTIEKAEEKTKHNTGLQLNIAFFYSGQWDIVNACRQIIQDVEQGVLSSSEVTVESFSKYVQLSDLPMPDLMIRTSGEQRISNFMLWQLAYAELYFSPKYWPEFTKEDFYQALNWYQTRERRFGKISEQLSN